MSTSLKVKAEEKSSKPAPIFMKGEEDLPRAENLQALKIADEQVSETLQQLFAMTCEVALTHNTCSI